MNSLLVKLGISLTALILAGCATTSTQTPTVTPSTETITPSASTNPTVTPIAPDTTTGNISESAAKEIALAHAGLSESDVTFLKVELDYDNGIAEYEVEFYSGNLEFDYEINAVTGAVISVDQEMETQRPSTDSNINTGSNDSTSGNNNTSSSTPADIGESEAKRIALEHAGLKESDVTFLKVERDIDKGVTEYEVEFYTATMEYDYDINASTGAIISFDHEMEMQKPSTGNTGSSNNTNSDSTTITEATAKQIALDHAGVKESDISHYRVEMDYDDGRTEYEIEFYVGASEYDYEINASTGAIISYDHDLNTPSTGGNSNTGSNSTTSITEAEAKTIALNHAGVKESDISRYTCKLDYDDGRTEYEIEFYVGASEYDYEINASTGAVISYDHDLVSSNTGSNSNTNSNATITEAEAKTIALNHAGVSTNEISKYKCELDYDDGITAYEIEWEIGRTEYDYKINANTGAILEFDVDYD